MTMSVADLPATVPYRGNDGVVDWAGYHVADEARFHSFLTGPVRARLHDAEASDDFEAELRGLVTTGMASEFLRRFLAAVPDEPGWAVGEAVAECLLTEDSEREIVWPWNANRDRRTPRASLPGADLVGFCRMDGEALLLFGEVKTSEDRNTPPGVMYGNTGLIWQLQENATRLDVQHALLRWLRARCNTTDLVELYRSAVTRYLSSGGKEILIVGLLLRDTEPSERDISGRASALARQLEAPTRVEVTAWYLPIPIAAWADLLRRRAP
ncbi:MAG: hypothetical protein HZC42_04515 [Candidatus Eisenbacteria bacterium]|nr:hypothetical protein [Candidatus Eisenbacteria bacterium]